MNHVTSTGEPADQANHVTSTGEPADQHDSTAPPTAIAHSDTTVTSGEPADQVNHVTRPASRPLRLKHGTSTGEPCHGTSTGGWPTQATASCRRPGRS